VTGIGSSVLECFCEERNHAIFVFRRCVAQSRSVFGTRYNPQLFRATCGYIDPFRVAARDSLISSAANQENRKASSGYRFFGRDIVGPKTADFGYPTHCKNGCWTEKRSPK
jgi:hypothetical protein